MTDSYLIEQAKLGDPQAIETLMNQSLQSRGMRAVVERQGDSLEVVLEAERIPNRQALTAFVQKGMANLDVQSIRSVRILGQQIGAGYPAWMQELQLEPSQPLTEAAPLTIQPETAAASTPTEYPSEPIPEAVPEPLTTNQINELGALWAEQSTEETPDFLQDLRSSDAEPTPELLEQPNEDQPNDAELLDFLNELSGTPANAAYPLETSQELSVFDNESSSVPSEADFQELLAETHQSDWSAHSDNSDSSGLWMDSTDFSDQDTVPPAGEPDADLLDFLDEAAPDAQTLDLTEFSTPPNDSETTFRFNLPAEEISSTFLSESSDPLPAADMPPPSLDNQLLDRQLDELFTAEPSNHNETDLFIEELPEQPPESREDLLHALVSEPVNEPVNEPVSEPSEPGSAPDELVETERDPWMEGSEDVVLGIPDRSSPESATETSEPTEELLPDFLRQPSPELQLVLEETPLTTEPESEFGAEQADQDATAETWQPWQPWQNAEPVSETAARDDIPTSDLTAADFSLPTERYANDPRPDSPEVLHQPEVNVPASVEPPEPNDFAWSAELSDSEVEVEEIPPDFLLDWQDDLPLSTPQSDPEAALDLSSDLSSDLPDAPVDLETRTFDQPSTDFADSSSELSSLESELAALDLADSGTELDRSDDSATGSDDFADLGLDLPESPDAELAELLSATPEGTAVEPPADWLSAASQPTDFPEELFAEPPATQVNSETSNSETSESNIPLDASVASAADLPDLSQETLEAGLGDFRTEFDEPLPPEFYQHETEAQEPLNLDIDESEADYIIEDSTPAEEYTPPPLPPQSAQPQPITESSGPAWLFPLILGLVCVLFAAIGFFVFWSKVRTPSNPPPASEPAEPPAAEPTAPAAPVSPTSANPITPTANNPAANNPVNPLKLAFERGATAVTLSQAAQSVDDWRLVASKWQQAIELLQSVPASSPNYAAAQQKLAEYRSYLTVAQQKAKQPIVAAVPLGAANIKTPAAQAAISCSPVAARPDSQPVELSRVQFDPAADQTQASPIVGCITNHTEQPIAAVDLSYSSSADNPANQPETSEASGKLNFSKLDPKQTVPFKSAFTIAPNISKVTIASLSWTAAGTSEAQQVPISVSIERSDKQEGEA